jgi:hypothetical protein
MGNGHPAPPLSIPATLAKNNYYEAIRKMKEMRNEVS